MYSTSSVANNLSLSYIITIYIVVQLGCSAVYTYLERSLTEFHLPVSRVDMHRIVLLMDRSSYMPVYICMTATARKNSYTVFD